MTGLYTLDSAALHARLGLLAALAGARKSLMLLPPGGGGTALQRLQLVGEIARVRKELGGVESAVAEASPLQAALVAAKTEFEPHNAAMKAGSVTPDGLAALDRYMAAKRAVEAGEKAEAWEAAKLREIPAANNAKHFIPKAEALTPAGALKADATNSRAGSSVWYYQGDVQALSFTASVTIGGEPHQFAEQAKAILAGIKAARERGFRLYNYRAGRLGTVWVLERDKVFMTRAGLESAANPVFDRPDMPPSAAGYENMLAQQTALAKSFATWLDTLPAEQRHARGVVTAKLRSTTAGEWADIQPDSHGGVLLQYRDEAGKPGIRIAGKDFDDMVAKARELAMMPEVEPAASPAAEAPEPAGEAPPTTDPVASLPVTDAPAAAQSVAEVVVEHTTAKGKVLRGVVRHGLTLAEAQKVDKYTFRKDGGYFIRERYLQQPEAAHEPADSPLEQQGRDLPSTGERDLEYIADGKIESPSQGLINSAKARKEAAFAQLKIVRERVKNGNSNRLDLMKAEFAHKDAVRDLDKAYEQLEKDANRQGLTTIKGRETENTRDNAAADLPQAKRRNRPLEYTGYSGQARSVRSYYEVGGYRIAKPHEGLFEVIDQDGQAIHQMAGLGGALSVVQRLGGKQPTTWEKLHAKVWKGSNGMYIVDESFTSGGRLVKMFAVYASQDDRHAGSNFTSGESLAEAKRKAAGVVLDDASLQLDSTGGVERLALLAELRRAMEALGAADDPAVRLDLLAEVARLRKALGSAEFPVVELAGDELGDFPDTPDGKKALRQAAIAEFERMTNGDGNEWVDCPALDERIELRRKGIKKVVSTSADTRKLLIVPRLKDLIRASAKIGAEKPNYDAASSNIAAYQTMRALVMLDGELLAVRFVLGRDDKSRYHYDHTIHAADAVLDSTKANGPAEADPLILMGGSRGRPHDRCAVPKPCRLLPAEPSPEHQDDLILDRASGSVNDETLNLFIEGEPPEPAEDAAPIVAA